MKFKCTICCKQGNFWINLKKICVTKCGHVFHLNCLMPQISSQSKSMIECPMPTCNKKMKQATIVKIDPLVIEKRKQTKHKNKPIDCILCNDAVKDPKNISITKCGHIHHFECLVELVRRQSDECLAPECKKKITLATIRKIHLVQGNSDAAESSQHVTAEELRASLEDDEDSFQKKNESSMDAPSSSKKLSKTLTFTQKCQEEDKKPKSSQIVAGKLFSPLLKNKKMLCRLKSDRLSQKIKRGLDMLDENGKLQLKNAISQITNEQIVELQKRNEELEQQVETLEKDRNDAKKETAIWEMSFTYLQDTFKDTDIMIPNEATLKLIKENEDMKICIQDLGRKLVSTKEDVDSANSLRADFENSVEENLNLKTEIEELKRELKTEKENTIKANSTITDIVMRHSQENENLMELNNSVLIENTRLSEVNETLKKENTKLNEPDHSLLNEITRLKELNETLTELNNAVLIENTRLSEVNETLHKESSKLNEPDHSLLNEITKLKQLNETLQKEYSKLDEPNHSLLNDITKLKQLNETLQKENHKLNEPNHFLLNEITKLLEQNKNLLKEKNKFQELTLSLQKEKRDFQWEVITRRRPIDDFRVTNKRQASEISGAATEKLATKDLVNKSVTEKVVTETVVKIEGAKETVVNEKGVHKEVLNEKVKSKESNIKRVKVEDDNEMVGATNMSSATEINQAISRLHYSVKME